MLLPKRMVHRSNGGSSLRREAGSLRHPRLRVAGMIEQREGGGREAGEQDTHTQTRTPPPPPAPTDMQLNILIDKHVDTPANPRIHTHTFAHTHTGCARRSMRADGARALHLLPRPPVQPIGAA